MCFPNMSHTKEGERYSAKCAHAWESARLPPWTVNSNRRGYMAFPHGPTRWSTFQRPTLSKKVNIYTKPSGPARTRWKIRMRTKRDDHAPKNDSADFFPRNIIRPKTFKNKISSRIILLSSSSFPQKDNSTENFIITTVMFLRQKPCLFLP